MKTTRQLSLCAVLMWALAGAARPAHTASVTMSSSQSKCFQVQFLLRLTGLEAQHFIAQVVHLRDMDPSDPAVPARVHALSLQAAGLRSEEAVNFTHVGSVLQRMGAPIALRTWALTETDALQGPVPMSQDERTTAATQPDTALILATLDECDRVKADTDDHMNTLGEWIGLSGHAPGLWAADVGELTAALVAGISFQVPPRLAVNIGHQLAATAPAGMPATVKDALGMLSPQTGNLSELAPTATTNIPLPEATAASNILIAAFAAQSLLPSSH